MGVSGTAIFSDDNAWDLRNEYLQLVGDGLSGPEATQKLLHEWSEVLDDSEVYPVFWLALAATQRKCGRLEPEVLQKAIEIIDTGVDLARWDAGSPDQRKRRVVLEKLRAQLTSPQPPQKRIHKRFRDSNEWQQGNLVAYRLLSGKFIVFRVIGHHTDKGGTAPICELLDWVGLNMPSESQLQSFSIRVKHRPHPTSQFMIGRIKANERPDDRLQPLGMNSRPSQEPRFYTVLRWRWLDDTLKEWFGLD
ncbi:MAG TPA: hypothetical protein VI685_24950 [Candidatus Angelobacter sp.]